jgi:hypothetical protein
VLQKYCYAGLLVIKKYYDDPETIKKGNHEPIVTEEMFWRAQECLKLLE